MTSKCMVTIKTTPTAGVHGDLLLEPLDVSLDGSASRSVGSNTDVKL